MNSSITLVSRISLKVCDYTLTIISEFESIVRNCIYTELPENAPRYVVLSYELKHDDGRISFPLILVNWAPRSSEMSLLTLHASAFLDFQATVRKQSIIFHPKCQINLKFISLRLTSTGSSKFERARRVSPRNSSTVNSSSRHNEW